jgi:hypothetical protein
MREYNEFFRFTPHAYFVAYVIYMAGVFDKTPGTISLSPLVREVKAAGQLTGQDAETVDELLVKAEPVVDKVLINALPNLLNGVRLLHGTETEHPA